MAEEVTIFIKSWNRPLYLWSCLDSFYRHTRFPARFILIDNASSDPQVAEVVDGFSRRGMFHGVHFLEENRLDGQDSIYEQYKDSIGSYIVLVDGDVFVEPSEPACWLEHLVSLANSDPKLAMLGSYIDGQDFVALSEAQRLYPDREHAAWRFLVKSRSPEREIPDSTQAIIRPFNPPGRFTLLRKSVIEEIGLRSGGKRFYKAACEAGWDAGIATGVRHRHLSLLNVYDYPEYDYEQRNTYYLPPSTDVAPGLVSSMLAAVSRRLNRLKR